MAWVALVFAGLFEIGGVIGIKGVSERKGWQYVLILALSFAASFTLSPTP